MIYPIFNHRTNISLPNIRAISHNVVGDIEKKISVDKRLNLKIILVNIIVF